MHHSITGYWRVSGIDRQDRSQSYIQWGISASLAHLSLQFFASGLGMLLPSNKKPSLLDNQKQARRPRPIPSIAKTRSKLQEMAPLPALDSLEVRCEGIKLNAREQREQRSPYRKRKVWRTDTLIRPILLLDYDLPRSTSLINPTTSFHFPLTVPQTNPEDVRKEKAPIIPVESLLLHREWRDGQGEGGMEERTAFLLSRNSFVGLHVSKEQRSIPSFPGLLETQGVAYLGSEGRRYYVSELHFGNSFRNLMNQFGKFQQRTAKHFLRQLLVTVHTLHNEGMSHNRLNLDSICHDCEGNLLVNFFKASNQAINETESLAYFYYFPPEVLLGGCGGVKADVWAIGCLCLQFLSGKTIRNSGRHPYNSFRLVGRQVKPSPLSDCLNGIIERRLRNGERRMEMEEIEEGGHDFIGRCLQLREEMRPNIGQLMEHPFVKE